MHIRLERPDDHEPVHRLTAEAFAESEFGHHGEADLVDELRKHGENTLSLTARAGTGDLIGHVLFTPCRTSDGKSVGMGLGPMSVSPSWQRKGVGSALVNRGLDRLAAQGCSFVVVLGHPEYYPRFGFLLASGIGLSHGFAGIPQDVFFAKLLNASEDGSPPTGRILYGPEFGEQEQ